MAGGVVVGVLQRRHADRIVLRDGTEVFLPAKLAAGEFVIGSSLTVAYTVRKDGKKVADNIWRCR